MNDKTYIPDRPCKRGHWLRYIAGKGCVECTNARTKAEYRADSKKGNALRLAWARAREAATPGTNARLSRAYRAKNPTKAAADAKAWRERNPDWAAAWYAENRESANANSKRWRKANPDRVRAISKRSRENNLEKVHAREKRWRANNPDKVAALRAQRVESGRAAAQSKRYREKHPDRIVATNKRSYAKRRAADPEALRAIWRKRKRNPEKRRAYSKINARRHPEKIAASVRKRQAMKQHATPAWLTKKDFELMAAEYGEAARLTELTGIKHVVDHVAPLRGKTVCGLHVPGNLLAIPAKANSVKHNRFNEQDLAMADVQKWLRKACDFGDAKFVQTISAENFHKLVTKEDL